MREAIGGTWIFGIVITFIVLFSGYLAVSVNYSKAFRVKNELVSLIEKYEGHGPEAQKQIETYLDGVGYWVYGSCTTEGRGSGFVATTNSEYKYCVDKVETSDSLNRAYFKVTVFFKLDLPVVGGIFTFPITGETKSIYFPVG